MSPGVTAVLILAALYILGRFMEHAGTNTGRVLNPSRCEHFDHLVDEEMDTWAQIWQERFDEDELEAWGRLPVYAEGIHAA